jgi:nitrite reductase/ring-hydroxylating ferredoxin subunit
MAAGTLQLEMAWHDAATLHDAGAAHPWLARRVRGVDLVLMALDGAWLAIEDRCSHAGCAFSEDGALEEGIVVCDCHGSEFDPRTGAVLRGPAERPIRTVPVRTAADRLQVDL